MADSLDQIGRDYAINFRRPGMTDAPTLSDGQLFRAGLSFDRGDHWRINNTAELRTFARAILAERPAAEPTITEHELAFALNYHSDDTRINDADWKIAGRYFDVILANRGTHPSLAGRPAVSPEPSELKERERCAAICDDEARIRRDAGDKHPAESPAQDRCYAAARAAMNCARGIRSGETPPAHQTARPVEAIEPLKNDMTRLMLENVGELYALEDAAEQTQRAADEDRAKRERALDAMVANAEALGLYDPPPAASGLPATARSDEPKRFNDATLMQIAAVRPDLLESMQRGSQVLEQESALQTLARRCLWIAYCWNDHNFEPAHHYALRTAKEAGIDNFEDANEWLAALAPKGEQE